MAELLAARMMAAPAGAALPADDQTGPGVPRASEPRRRHHPGRPRLGADAGRGVVRRAGRRPAGQPESAPAGPTPDYQPVGFGADSPPLLDPSVPFAVHTADGARLSISSGDRTGAGFRLDDPDLAGYVILDFDGVRLARGGRADRRPRPRPVPPDRRPRAARGRSGSSTRGRCSPSRAARTSCSRATFPLPRFYLPREDVAARARRREA